MGSFLIIGMGRFGRAIAVELHQMKHDVMVLDESEERIARVVNRVTNAVIGDAKDETVLHSLGIQNFDCIVVAIADHLDDSILATMILKDLGAKMIVCKANDERHTRMLTMIGADRVIRPELEMGKRVARSLAQRNIIDFFEISEDFGVMEIITPKNWIGKSIVKNDLRRKFGITVITIERGRKTKKVIFSPDVDADLREGDILTIIGAKNDLEKISALR